MDAHQTHRLRPRNLPQSPQALREWRGAECGVREVEVGACTYFWKLIRECAFAQVSGRA